MEAAVTTAEHVPNPREGLTMVKVAQCQSADFESRQENTALVGMLLTIRHVSMSDGGAKPTLTSGSIRHTAGQSGMNRQRLSNMQGRPYDRIATFADLQDPGACFAVVLKNPRESQHFSTIACAARREWAMCSFWKNQSHPTTHSDLPPQCQSLMAV